MTSRSRLSAALFAPVFLTAFLATSCGGGGRGADGGADGGVDGGQEVPIDVTVEGRVVLGVLGGATVDIYGLDDLGSPLATTMTSMGPALGDIGSFSVMLSQILPSDFFLFVVREGQAFDVNTDGMVDPLPTNNSGVVHALASGARLDEGPISISILTEVAYWRLRYFLAAEYEPSFVQQSADSVSTFLLRESLDATEGVDWDDVLAFNPLQDREALIRPYDRFENLALLVLSVNSPARVALGFTDAEIVHVDLPGNGRGIDVVGNLSYFGDGANGLRIDDISVPEAPNFLGSFNTPGTPFDIQVVGALAYVADYSGGLQIIDVSNPAAPTLVQAVAVGSAQDLDIAGDQAFVTGGDFFNPMVHVVDISPPATASLLGSAPTADFPRGIVSSGNYVYVTSNGVEVFDVSIPSSPVSVRHIMRSIGTQDAAVAGGYLFVTTDAGMEVFSISTPERPVSVASVSLPGDYSGKIRLDGDRALLTRSFDGVHVVDIADPDQPIYLGGLAVLGPQNDIGVGNGILVTSDINGGFHTVAYATPMPSAAIAQVEFTGRVQSVTARDGGAWVGTSFPNELWSLDTGDPVRATRQAGVVVARAPTAIGVRDDLAFLSTDGAGLQLADVSDVSAPVTLLVDQALRDLLGLRDLALAGGFAYAGRGDAIQVVDISTPTAPVAGASVTTPRTVGCVEYDADANALLVCHDFLGIKTFDLATPATPVQSGSVDTTNAVDIALRSPTAFVAESNGAGGGALLVVDYSTLSTPVLGPVVTLPGSARAVTLEGDLAYVSSGTGGIDVVDVRDPATPFYAGSLPVPGDVTKASVGDDLIYAAAGDDGVFVLRAYLRDVP